MTVTGTIEFSRRGDDSWLSMAGDIDIDVVDPITDARLAEYQTSGAVYVDLSAVTFLDSLGVGLLLRLRQIGSFVHLIGPSHDVMRTLQLCGVASLFEIEAAAA